MSEKLCLQWNDFQDNVKSAFENLRENTDFADVTLACEDGHQIEAHKVILAASSPFFQSILQKNNHSHPLIYMRGVKSADLAAIVDFLYLGEANVDQENLDNFLAIAMELQLQGLKGSCDQNELKGLQRDPLHIKPNQKHTTNQILSVQKAGSKESKIAIFKEERKENNTVSLPSNLEQLDETVKSMMETSQSMFQSGRRQQQGKKCKVCGKEGRSTDIMRHIEVNHLEGVSIPCNLCDKIFKSRLTLSQHVSKYHKQN